MEGQPPGVRLPKYVGATKANWYDYIRDTIIPDIHSRGGLASYNHPYGTGFGPMKSPAEQDRLLSQVAMRMLPSKACGADIIEVGYPIREGMDLAHHVGLWDVCSRNAVFLTGNGVSDDHAGTNWRAPRNVTTWTTSVWAADRAEVTLLRALRAGRAWCASLTGYRGALDLLVDGTCPMGSASVSELSTRKLKATATDAPRGGRVEIVQGVVDYAGLEDPSPATQRVATFPDTALTRGSVDLVLDTRRSSFVRSQVRNSAGTVMALSNPVWLLRKTPPSGIPSARAC